MGFEMRTPLSAENLVAGVKQEILGVALEPGERVLDKAQATLGLMGGGDLSLTSRRLVWAGTLNFLPFAPSWFVPGWRLVVPLRSINGVYDQGSVLLVVEASGSHYEFGLRRWFIPSGRLAQQWVAAVEEARLAAIQSERLPE
jgi:hypothetical protein